MKFVVTAVALMIYSNKFNDGVFIGPFKNLFLRLPKMAMTVGKTI